MTTIKQMQEERDALIKKVEKETENDKIAELEHEIAIISNGIRFYGVKIEEVWKEE